MKLSNNVMLIGLIGPKGCGKSTIASEMLKLDVHVKPLPFKAPLHKMLLAIGLTPEQLIDPVLKEKEIAELNASPRRLMQTLGTEWGRNMISLNIWTNAWEREAYTIGDLATDEEPILIVTDDVRFQNEADAIHRLGGVLVRVEREGVTYDPTHESEAGGDIQADLLFKNNQELTEGRIVSLLSTCLTIGELV